jgi:16S rRNA (guanine527-N7)-methyltransferase
MPTLPETRIAHLLTPFLEPPLPPLPLAPQPGAPAPTAPLPALLPQLSNFLDLLLRWNARTNLTAIRDPEEIVTRHFGESLFTGRILSQLLGGSDSVLDFGSGAGFPGLPIKLLAPSLHVTLAESQNKKAAFLQEARRTLFVDEIWPRRVEDMPADRRFNAITLRAVDKMPAALTAAHPRLAPVGFLAVLTSEPEAHAIPIPHSQNRFVDLRPA